MSNSHGISGLARSFRQATQILTSAGSLDPEVLPDEWVRKTSTGKRALELRSRAWTSRAVQRLRFTEIDGEADLYVANIGLVPHPASAIPVVHAEAVVIGGKLRVFILDVEPLAGRATSNAIGILRALRAALRRIEPETGRPAWADAAISPNAIWGHGDTDEALAEAASAVECFGRSIATILRPNDALRGDPRSSAVDRTACLRAMRNALFENEPSRPFLRATFGTEWTEHYLAEFLLPLPAGRAEIERRVGTEIGAAA